ncbi:MAG: ATP-binding protein [Planctomycetota bacterium]
MSVLEDSHVHAEPKGKSAQAAVTPDELAELMGVFNEVTARLERTHADLRGQVARLQGELRDANEQLQRSRRLAALGEMAAGIAHEVRNPLGSIQLYAQMLREDLTDRPEQCETAGKIGGAVRRLNAVVGDVLAFSRDMTPRPTWCEAGALFDAALEGSVRECAGVEIRRRGEGVEVYCDAVLMNQALTNLVRNAVEAMADQGGAECSLSVAAERKPIDGVEMVGLCVTDTGPGIPPEIVDRMFNPFFTTRHTGTGLGLAIVHRIVDVHGGRVLVGSGADGGASVELLLPAGAGAEDRE